MLSPQGFLLRCVLQTESPSPPPFQFFLLFFSTASATPTPIPPPPLRCPPFSPCKVPFSVFSPPYSHPSPFPFYFPCLFLPPIDTRSTPSRLPFSPQTVATPFISPLVPTPLAGCFFRSSPGRETGPLESLNQLGSPPKYQQPAFYFRRPLAFQRGKDQIGNSFSCLSRVTGLVSPPIFSTPAAPGAIDPHLPSSLCPF